MKAATTKWDAVTDKGELSREIKTPKGILKVTLKLVEISAITITPPNVVVRGAKPVQTKWPATKQFHFKLELLQNPVEAKEFDYTGIFPGNLAKAWMRDRGLVGYYDEVLQLVFKLQAELSKPKQPELEPV